MLDDHLTKKAAVHCSERAYLNYIDQYCKGNPSFDFREGWRQAYIDLAFGADGATPAIPPEKYWKANNRTCPGHERVKDWFAGYEAGVCNARAQGRTDYITIQSSVCRPAANWVGPPGAVAQGRQCSTCR